jgi:GntR family transcriptional repressor for pyruvate dehydrogenase complex
VTTYVVEAVARDEYPAGAQLPTERALARELNVSRTAVRDAIKLLCGLGLLEQRHGAGTFVARYANPFTTGDVARQIAVGLESADAPDDALDVRRLVGGYFLTVGAIDQVALSLSAMIRIRSIALAEVAEARRVTEAATAALAADRASAVGLNSLGEALEQGRALINDPSGHAEASMSYHVELARAAGNEVLQAEVSAYKEVLIPNIRDLHNQESRYATQAAHERILSAVRAHDSRMAQQAMVTHLLAFETRFRRRLQAKSDFQHLA